ncbi:multicopper oxidase family protein [Alicyclobacillus fastidiosus]|uniref:Multicopper oxidase domain-containing protein n=1 Tax=Alicyclobacillus fastidiosus TaxID=392011 RepID=A0ABV5AE56_9BACL
MDVAMFVCGILAVGAAFLIVGMQLRGQRRILAAKASLVVGIVCLGFALVSLKFYPGAALASNTSDASSMGGMTMQQSGTQSGAVRKPENSTPQMAMMGVSSSAVGVTDASSQALTQSQIAAQNKTAVDLMHEQGMVPKVLKDGTKQFTLTAAPVVWRLYQSRNVNDWGYNGSVPGPLIRVRVGDHVQIVLHNKLPEATTLHLQGISLPSDMDGVPGVSQKPIASGGSFVYKFTVTPDMVGTHAYFSDMDASKQIDAGLHGVLLVDPAHGKQYPKADVDALFELGGLSVDSSPMENVFTMDGKPAPNAPQLTVKVGQDVVVRLVNNTAQCYHAMHLHGYTFRVVAQDGHALAKPISENVISLAPAETADIEFVANNPGMWMFHCHILDHMTNPDDDVDEMGGLTTYFNVVQGGTTKGGMS